MSLIISLRSEVLKTKRTAAFYFTLIGAAVIPAMLLLTIVSDGLPEEERTAKDPINALFHLASQMNGLMVFPLFIVLICTLLPQIEFKNSTWKQVFASPQKKEDVYVAKFLSIHLLMILFLLASHFFMWIVVVSTHFIVPDARVLEHSVDAGTMAASNAHIYLSVLGICAIQFWIGLRSRNFIVPVAIGVACWIFGSVLVFEYKSSASPYFPYSYPAVRMSGIFKSQLEQMEWTSLGYSILFLLVGFYDFKRRRRLK